MPIPEIANQVNRVAVKDEVYATLVEWIVNGTLKPNEKLRDKELADALGVSRTPIREALQRLEDMRLVETSASRWTQVASLNLEQAKEVYPVVWSLEALAMELAGPQLKGLDLCTMRSANKRLEQALQDEDAPEALQADRDFHDVFISRAQNIELAKSVNGLKLKIRRLEIVYFGGSTLAKRSITEHRKILASLRANNFDQATKEVKENWRASLDRIMNLQS